jgi:hypothetical protein
MRLMVVAMLNVFGFLIGVLAFVGMIGLVVVGNRRSKRTKCRFSTLHAKLADVELELSNVRSLLDVIGRYLNIDKLVFSDIYANCAWGVVDEFGVTNRSGQGSIKGNAIPYLEYLQDFLDSNKPKTIVDLGCGNWELMKHITIPDSSRYVGVDLVGSVIEDNKKLYEKSNVTFEEIGGLRDFKEYSSRTADS